MKKIFLIIASLCLGISFAQQREDMNLKGERKRVAQGIESGEIKPEEAKLIRHQARQLKRTKRQAMKDGVITPKERAEISRKDRKLDKTIYRTKHN